jgi:Tfp pilus assembly protein PilO
MFDSGTVQIAQIAAAKQEHTLQTKQLAEINQKLDRAHEYQRSTSEMGEALNRLLSYIPENFRLQDFMKTVSEEAKIAGLNIIRVQEARGIQKSLEKKIEFEELAVSIELQGTFSQQMTFLANLTKQKQIFLVEKFTLEKDPNGGNAPESESPLLYFRAEIRAYRYVGAKAKS